jgi:hypothetical protein
MKDILGSVLKYGKDSPSLNKFIELCLHLSLSAINISKYKEYILSKTGLSIKDLAYDSIADLFKQTDGKYLYIDNYCRDIKDKLDNVHEDIVKAKLSALIISRTRQRITEIREDFGEIYFRVKKAIYLHLKRNRDIFKSVIYNEDTYIFTCPENELDFKKEKIPNEFVLESLNSTNHTKISVTKIVDFIFEQINKEKYYRKALIDTDLYNITSEFYKLRREDFLSESENVPYFTIEEETKD